MTGAIHSLDAEVVWVEETGKGAGVGVMFSGFDDLAGERLAAFVAVNGLESARATNVMERVRGYSISEQMRRAREADQSERQALERVYDKAVWEPLLQNPRISPPEVARIARKGTLTGPLIDLITGSAAWLASPEIRRALLTNPRVTGPALDKVIATCSKKELGLIASQVLYPMSARQAARRKLKR